MNKNYLFKVRMLLCATLLLMVGWSAHAQFPAPYCAVQVEYGVEPITLVQIGSINNPTSNSTGSPVMEDFTSMSTPVSPTGSYTITLKGNSDGNWDNYYRVYVDWNNDNDFNDAGESYDIGIITNSTGVDNKFVDGDIVVPADATPGPKRMRVVKQYDVYGSACGLMDFGQTEDYTLVVGDPPTCLSPTGLALSGSAGTNTATITWVAPASAPANGYEYYVSTNNTPPTAVTEGTDATGVTVNLTGLASSTLHYVWVRSDCGDGDYSAWTSAVSFTTACDTYAAPFSETFSGGVRPNCWTNVSTYNSGNALWKFTGTVDYAPGNTRAAGTFAWVDGSDPSGGVNDVTLTSPPIDISTLTEPQLLFDYFSNHANGDYPNNIFTVQVYNGSTWVEVYTNNSSLAVWRTITVPLDNFTGIIQVRFIVDKTAAPDGWAFYNDILLDNVIVQETPACSAPTSLNLEDANPFDLTVEWAAASSNPDGYQYELRSSGAAGSGATGLVASGDASGTSQMVSTLTPETSYTFYVRSDCGAGVYSDWVSLAVATIPIPPANDDCTGAIMLTVNPDLQCAVTTPATTLNATQSMAASPCYGNPEDDVWFSFVATEESHFVSLTNIVAVGGGTSTDMYWQVLSGDCGTLTSEVCSDPESGQVNNLVPGETYFIRVYNYYTTRNTFNICVGTYPDAPDNDDCEGAIALTVNADLNCGVKTSATTVSATQSMAATPCYGNPDDDVWFSFVATAESHVVTVSDIVAVVGSGTDMYFQVLEGACGGHNSLVCSDPNQATVNNLVIGETYYVRVYSYNATSRHNFSICIGTMPDPPANDDCEGAIMLIVNPDLSCVDMTAGTTVGATNSMAASPCYGNPDDDVWYTFVATTDTHIVSLSNIVGVIGGSTDMYIQILEGACDALASSRCSDPESVTVDNLIPGETYYIRVYSYANNYNMNFDICVTSLPTDPPVNDDCEGAIELTPGATFDLSGVEVGSNGLASTSSGAPAPGCANYNGGDVWYTVVVPASGSITVETNRNPGSAITDMGMAVYSGTCGGTFTLIECDDDDSDDGNFSKIILTNRTAGETIYVRVWEYGNDAVGTFKIAAYDASLSTESFTAGSLTHYPNPVKDVLNLSYTSEITSVDVYNMLGQQVITRKVNATETAVDMSALADGAYIVNVTAGDSVKTIKVIKNQ